MEAWWNDLVAGGAKSAANQWWESAGRPTREQVPIVYDAPGVMSLETVAKREIAGHNAHFNSFMTDFTNMDGMQNQVQSIYHRQTNPNFQLSSERLNAANANEQDIGSRWTASQQDSGGLGGFAGVLGGILGAVFAPATFGISAALGAALGGGAATLLTTGDPMKALLAGGFSYLGGQVMSGFGGAPAGMEGAVDVGTGEFVGQAASGYGPQAGGGIVESTMANSGISTDPGKFLTASVSPNLSGTMTDVTPGMLNGAADTAVQTAAAPAAAADGAVSNDWLKAGAGMDGGGFAPGAGGPPATGGGGIVDTVMKFGKDNPVLASGIMQVGGGMLKGMGDRKTAEDLMATRVAADERLQQQKLDNAIALEEWKRRFTQSGSYFDAKVPMKAAGGPLRRPDGSAVYAQPGIVTGAMA